ncbi:hypothetical protein V6N11_082526 [Hibiscus sabdariffa]|uniref:Uncharacterized protein n=1 Tax=Hibiscus sabdariffa TaxID=183260 RepID=A0ABR2N8Y1_9ROSI
MCLCAASFMWSGWVINDKISVNAFWNQLLSCGCQHEFMLLTCMLSLSGKMRGKGRSKSPKRRSVSRSPKRRSVSRSPKRRSASRSPSGSRSRSRSKSLSR